MYVSHAMLVSQIWRIQLLYDAELTYDINLSLCFFEDIIFKSLKFNVFYLSNFNVMLSVVQFKENVIFTQSNTFQCMHRYRIDCDP